MYSLILFVFLLIPAIYLKKENAVLFLLALLPFYNGIKSIFQFFDGGGIVIFWKELFIFIVGIRVFFEKKSKFTCIHFPKVSMCLLSVLLILYLIISDQKYDAINSIRLFLLPIIFGFIVASMSLDNNFVKRFLTVVLICSIIIFILGYIQHYFFRVEFAFFLGTALDIDESGRIIYVYGGSGNTIMNIDRMNGIFTGPNEFGIYTYIICILTIYFIINRKNFIPTFSLTILILTLIVGVSILLNVYSRVSWILTLFSLLVIITSTTNDVNAFVKNSIVVIMIFLTVFIGYHTIPYFKEVFTATISGEEGSARERPSEFINGFKRVIEKPLGDGLGLVSYRSSKQKYHTEIFWWMIFLESGWLGGLLYLYIYLKILFILNKKSVEEIINPFVLPAKANILSFILAGFGSVILLEPIFMIFMWSIVGLALNRMKLN